MAFPRPNFFKSVTLNALHYRGRKPNSQAAYEGSIPFTRSPAVIGKRICGLQKPRLDPRADPVTRVAALSGAGNSASAEAIDDAGLV